MMGRSTRGEAAIFSTTKPSGTVICGSSCCARRQPTKSAASMLLRLSQYRSDDLVPDLVAVLVHVQAVGPEQFGSRSAIGRAHLARGLDVAQALVGFRVGLDQIVRLLALRVLGLARDAG